MSAFDPNHSSQVLTYHRKMDFFMVRQCLFHWTHATDCVTIVMSSTSRRLTVTNVGLVPLFSTSNSFVAIDSTIFSPRVFVSELPHRVWWVLLSALITSDIPSLLRILLISGWFHLEKYRSGANCSKNFLGEKFTWKDLMNSSVKIFNYFLIFHSNYIWKKCRTLYSCGKK